MSVDHDALLTRTIAGHFPDARITDNEIDLGIGELRIACRVDGFTQIGDTTQASLFFQLWGGRLGETPIFASVSGYESTPERAIVLGGCNWACVFGPVLLAAAADIPSEDVSVLELEVDGRPFRVFVDGLYRAFGFADDGPEPEAAVRDARARLAPEGWMCTRVLRSGTLPRLAADKATVISAFVMDLPGDRTFEVKVNGRDWPPSQGLLADAPAGPEGIATMLRELAIAVPRDPTDASRRVAPELIGDALPDALAQLREHAGAEQRPLLAWRGWATHGGMLRAAVAEDSLAGLEAIAGRLPEDYRAFVTTMGAAGAGPGYGLLSPLEPKQLELARGELVWRNGECPSSPPRGVIALAHAGCGNMWLLVVSGPRRGEVWIDPVGSDQIAKRVAPSFTAWYRSWLDAALQGAIDFVQWDPNSCASQHVFAQLFAGLAEQGLGGAAARQHLAEQADELSIELASGGSAYFTEQSALDPCQSCCLLAADIGMPQSIYPPGVPPLRGGAPIPHEASPGLFGRVRRFFGGN